MPPGARGTPVGLRPTHPRKLVVSHADNHLFHLTIVSVRSLSIPLRLRWSARPRILPTMFYVVIDHSSDRSLPIHLVRDVGALPRILDGLRYESPSSAKTPRRLFGQLQPNDTLGGYSTTRGCAVQTPTHP